MIALDELIAHHRQREKQCSGEIDHCAEVYRKNRAMTEADCTRCMKVWADERRVARDTVAWLETIRNRALSA